MKNFKLFLFFTVLSFNLFANGEISFRKQREKVLKEQQEEDQREIKQVKKEKLTITNKEKSIRQAVLETAFSKMGTPYIYGANGNGAYDCSSYVQFVYKKSINLNLPRVSYQQAESGKKVKVSQMKAGDLVAFDKLNNK